MVRGIVAEDIYRTQTDAKEENRAFGKIDLNNLIEEGETGGEENEDEHDIKLFRNALDFSEVKLRECIVPRPDIVALSIDSSLDELRELFVKTGLVPDIDLPGFD